MEPAGHPSDELRESAARWQLSFTDKQFAEKLDAEDPLRHLRSEFFYPRNKDLPVTDLSLADGDSECVYLCGNSLGLLPKKVKERVNAELDKWARHGVYGHLSEEMPWAFCDECCVDDMAKLVGAKPEECAAMNGLTVNQHVLMISFYQPTPTRHKILLEKHAFPSDHYCVESQIQLKGYDPATSMICVSPREGEETLRLEDILELIEKEGESIALVMLPGVQYYTGQFFQLEAITKAAHAKGCYVGFDLAHAVGNVEMFLHDWDVDFACWCTYKYMNSGAGCMAGAYMHERFAENDFVKLTGWWSHKYSTRFNMDNKLERSPGLAGYRISNPPIMTAACLRGSLDVFNMTSMKELRTKSKLLTGYLEMLIQHHFPKPANEACDKSAPYVHIITPLDPDQRGCQLSLLFSVSITKIFSELKKRGVVLDKREPDVLRVAPTPMYNSFTDVHKFVQMLGDVILMVAQEREQLPGDIPSPVN